MGDIIYLQKRPVLREPYLIAAWPGMGDVALKAAHYLKDKLEAREFARISLSEYFPSTGVLVKNAILKLPLPAVGRLYFWRNKYSKNDLIIFICDSQPNLEKGSIYAQKVLEELAIFNIKRIYTFAAMPVPVEHTRRTSVFVAATDRKLLLELRNLGLKNISSGQVSGLNGLFLGIAKGKNIEGVCLLGEIPLYTIQIENPKTSLEILKVFSKILNINIDTGNLEQQAKDLELEIAKLMDYLKLSSSAEPIGEDEIEKIKKSLAAYTKLPGSAKKTIEKLFEYAKKDIAKADVLKKELDKWNVYKEYEDRFLDLFKNRDFK